MPLGTEIGLGPGHNVLYGDPVRRGKGHSSPHSQFVVYERSIGLSLGDIVLDGGISSSFSERTPILGA